MPDHGNIYRFEAEKYDALISKQPSLLEAIRTVRDPKGIDIMDIGAGTGRLTVPLAHEARSILALDASEAMLSIAAKRLRQAGLINWRTACSDVRSLAAPNASADLVVAGWSLCYVSSSTVSGWEHRLETVWKEIRRVLRPGGTVMILETLGTGVEHPSPPDFLTGYYSLLAERYGFNHRWLRTDYAFTSVDEAERLTRFFFGEALARKVAEERLMTVPECAGMWWRNV